MKDTSISRRSLFQAAGCALGVGFVPKAISAEKEEVWTGYTACDSCNQMPMCGTKFTAKGNNIISIANWTEHPSKILCSKGLASLQRLYNPNRLLYPMKRTNPKGSADPGWVRITWEEAIKTIVGKLAETKAKYGPDSVMFYCGDPKEPRPAVQRLARYFESVHYGTESSTACRKGSLTAEELIYGQENAGSGAGPQTKTFMVMATNKAWSGPQGWMNMIRAAKKRGTTVITIDCRRTKAAELADIHLQPRQGTDGALAFGIMHVLIKENLYNKEFVDKWCHGFEQLKKYVERFTPEYASKETGVPAELIVKAARMYAKGPGSFALTSQSISHAINGVNNTRALLCIPAILGYIDVPGGAMFPVNPDDYICWDNGMTHAFVDYYWFKDPQRRARRTDYKRLPVWNAMQIQWSPNHLPEDIKAGKIHALAAWGFNVMIWPQTPVYQEALRNLDFAFACDYFYRETTHKDLDIILPSAMNFERHAPFLVHGGGKVVCRKPVKPLGECWEDWKIALTIGAALVDRETFFDGDPVKACDWMLTKWGTTYAKQQAALPKVLPVAIPKQQPYKYEKGLLRRDGKPGFCTPTGKIELFSEVQSSCGFEGLPEYFPPMKPTKQYPLKLINGTRKPYITHSKTRMDSPYLFELEDYSTMDINPKDARDRGLKDGDYVLVRSAYGGPVSARVNCSIIVPPGTIGMQYGWTGDQNTQVLIPRQWDKISGYAPYFEVCVQVEKDSTKHS